MFVLRSILFFISTLILVIICYYYIDRPVAEYFYALRSTEIVMFFKKITNFGKSEWFLVPSILLYFYFNKTEQFRKAHMALYFFMTNVVAGIGVWFLKVPFGRMRPGLYLEQNLYGFRWFEIDPYSLSFPSGHTITVMSSAVALSLLFPRWKYLFLPLGIIVSFSRVVVAAHYVSDVIFALFLGTMTAIVLYRYYISKGLL
ncbi:MAG: phosphatase PAP2 family protein [Sulfurovaceae bacterium]|nr:phosphatase PAP2 family protein [Sulfurovaceae bacterium]